ncbi:type II secretory pathway component [Chromatiaceae bacterium AAb-1]|nr:type II secretory pathway component [Chromatiaceae bacterium AAb-1]
MYPNPYQQQGSALVTAVFIMLVMLALVLSLSRLLVSGSETLVYEVQGTRAFLAAQSALEIAMTDVLPLNNIAAGACETTKTITFPSVFPEISHCTVTVGCSETNVYQLTSTAVCESGKFITSRTVQMAASQ